LPLLSVPYIFSCRIFYIMSPLLFFYLPSAVAFAILLYPISCRRCYSFSQSCCFCYSISPLLSPLLYFFLLPVAFPIPYLLSCRLAFRFHILSSPVAFSILYLYSVQSGCVLMIAWEEYCI
jgi:hypothetical protein